MSYDLGVPHRKRVHGRDEASSEHVTTANSQRNGAHELTHTQGPGSPDLRMTSAAISQGPVNQSLHGGHQQETPSHTPEQAAAS